jgi:hypothetical protein
MQSLTGIYLALKPETPLPYFRNAALSTDTCLEYIRLIKQVRPKLILELGSGSSTVIAGYQLKLNGLGRVIALDHDEKWGGLTRDSLLDHGIVDFAEVRIASLKPIKMGGHQYHWYDLSKLQDITSIDILLIDGPPDTSDRGFRYPGLELLSERLSEDCVILVDDCVMPRWNRTVLTWANENGFIAESLFLNEKNTVFLRRQLASVAHHKKARDESLLSGAEV